MAETKRVLNITSEEIESGKGIAVLAYFIFFVPLLMEDMRKNKFVMFHTEQAIVILILWFALGIVIGIFSTVTCGLGSISIILLLAPIIFTIMGIINAVNGNATELPIVGQYGEKLNLVK